MFFQSIHIPSSPLWPLPCDGYVFTQPSVVTVLLFSEKKLEKVLKVDSTPKLSSFKVLYERKRMKISKP